MSMGARTFITMTVAITVTGVVAGLIALGSPAVARERRLDERRVDDLARISNAIEAHQSQNGELPTTLSELEPQFGSEGPLGDPATKQPYEYRQIDAGRYELCAAFQQRSRYATGFLTHSSGRQCFKRKPGIH